MATVTPSPVTFDREATQKRIRHPLQALRGYIRRYVTLEGAAIAIIFLALVFWIGLALDLGIFQIFAIDWIKELDLNFPAATALWVRRLLLAGVLIGLVGLVAFKVLRRLFTEFGDSSLALVLERRFPRELGDRLITAVELADPKMSERYGYSQVMVDKTVRDAADRVEQLPVRDVFDWNRLYKLWGLALASTLGLYLLLFVGYIGFASVTGQPMGGFFWSFNRAASVFTKRNGLLMQRVYWPTRSYVEIVRFQDSADHPGEMKVGRDESRPDVQARAYKWVIYDANAVESMRPLRFSDLKEWVSEDLLNIPLPDDWGYWLVDLDDLDPSVPSSAVPAEWHGKRVSEVREALMDPNIRKTLEQANALQAVEDLLSWRTWSIDKIQLQLENTEVSRFMREQHQEARDKFHDLIGPGGVLDELSQSPLSNWDIRQLEIPDQVLVVYRGQQTKSYNHYERTADNRYFIGLNELKESVRFVVWGENFCTRPRYITLVPPPSFSSLVATKEEPAYLYYYLSGDQTLLKGKRQLFTNQVLSPTATVTRIEVPIGTNLEIFATADRPLKDGLRVDKAARPKVKGAIVPQTSITLDSDKKSFSMRLDNIRSVYEFEFKFNDLDNVKGSRHVLIEPQDDTPPKEGKQVNVLPYLRKPKLQTTTGTSTGLLDGYLITPDALLPIVGEMRDDHGLTRVEWVYDFEEVDFELFGDSGQSLGSQLANAGQQEKASRNLKLVSAGFPVVPTELVPRWNDLATFCFWVSRISERKAVVTGAPIPLSGFEGKMELIREKATGLKEFELQLREKAPRPILLKEWTLENEKGFDMRQFLPNLKVKDATKEAQLHYRLRLFVSATDNNIETGPNTTQSRTPIVFLVVSENELMSQILVQEEDIRNRLENAVKKLRDGKISLEEQAAKLSDQAGDLNLVAIRVSEVQKALHDAATTTRDVYQEYIRIKREMEINRVDEKRIETVDLKICLPLEDIINPNSGNFAATEEVLSKLYSDVEADAQLQIAKASDAAAQEQIRTNRPLHIAQTQLAQTKLDELISKLDMVLDAIGGELDYGQAVNFLMTLERDQRVHYRRLQDAYRDEEQRLFRELGGDGGLQ